MKKGQKTPYYGKRTKRQVIKAYFESSASMDESSEIHGALGSNTVASWLKKYGNLGISKSSKSEIMPKQLKIVNLFIRNRKCIIQSK